METLELQDSAKRRGHFALYNCLVLGHTKHNGVQRVYCNPFPWPDNTFYGSHRLDLVMIRPPGIESGGFIVSPDTVWYARVLLLFSASAATDTGSKSFDCALVSTLETYDDPENGNYINYANYILWPLYGLWLLCSLCSLWLLYSLFHYSLVGVGWFSGCVRARLEETCSLCHPHRKYPGKTSCCACWSHWNHSSPPAKRLSGSTRRPQAGCRRRMQDVVCQLVGIGMVP